VTQTYHTPKLKGLIKIGVNQTQEAIKVEKSWTSPYHEHQNVSNYILNLLYFLLGGRGGNKILKSKSSRKSKMMLTQIKNVEFLCEC
jgi:hypothetical protein